MAPSIISIVTNLYYIYILLFLLPHDRYSISKQWILAGIVAVVVGIRGRKRR